MGEETKQTSIPATIGRMVWYKMPNGSVRPATIVQVWNDDMVNLQVFTDGLNDAGMFKDSIADMMMTVRGLLWRTSVKRGEGNGEWDWMPYQKGQAAKTEEAEKKVEEYKNQDGEKIDGNDEVPTAKVNDEAAADEDTKEETTSENAGEEKVDNSDVNTGEDKAEEKADDSGNEEKAA